MMLYIKKLKKQKNILTREQESVIIITVMRIVTLRGFTLKTFFCFLVITWRVFYMMEELCLGF